MDCSKPEERRPFWTRGRRSNRSSRTNSRCSSRPSPRRQSRNLSDLNVDGGASTNSNTESVETTRPSAHIRLQSPNMSAVRRLLTGSAKDSDSSKTRNSKSHSKQQQNQQNQQQTKVPPPCIQKPKSIDRQIVMLRELSNRCAFKESNERLDECVSGDYQTLLKLFQISCDVQPIIHVIPGRGTVMSHMHAERLKAMAINIFGSDCTVTIVSNGAGVLFVVQREGIISLLYEGLHFDISIGEETSIDVVLQALIENSTIADVDDLKAILASIKWQLPREGADVLDDLNAGGLEIPGLKLLRPEFFTTRVLAMMLSTDIYEQGFFKKYVHADKLGNKFAGIRDGESSTLSKLTVMPDAACRPVKTEADLLGEDLFIARRKGRKDKFRLTCSVSVNIWEEYEAPEWFGYIHPPPNADSMRPSTLTELKDRLEAYGVPDGSEVCRLVYHCLGHKSRNSNVKVDTLSAARSYFMYLKNFLKHGTTGGMSNHVIEGEEMVVVLDGIAYRVTAPQTEMRHRSLFLSLVVSDERERNGKNVPKRSVVRRMCSTSEVVLSICKDITYLNAEYDEEGGTLYSASAEEENTLEAWATCIALYICDGYGCLEGCFNCAIDNRRGSIVDEMAVFMNDVQVPVVFDKLYRKTSIADELSTMSDARGATYPGAFISGRDQCNERTYLAGRSHRLSGVTLTQVLIRENRLAVHVKVHSVALPGATLDKMSSAESEKRLIAYQ